VLGVRHLQKGMTLIELMVGLAVVAILFSLAAPSFSTWIQNTHIRTAAEAVQNGLLLTRAEAVRRNAPVRFQLTDTLDNSCALSTSGTNYVISQDDPSGACASPIADPSDPNPAAPRIIQTRSGAEGSKNALVSAPQSTVIFNGLGRVTPVPAGDINFSISNPVGGNCVSQGGQMRCLRINTTPGGLVRMCDPMFPSTDPQGCPACPTCPF
jgi:type IV fimbrial biogenesis protein FimT